MGAVCRECWEWERRERSRQVMHERALDDGLCQLEELMLVDGKWVRPLK
jgi:hypothetical protein